jgi:hypothetical protein
MTNPADSTPLPPSNASSPPPTAPDFASAAGRRLLYIAGYGRSGSTILDIALSAHPDIVGFGELAGVFDELADPPDDLDPFWADLAATTRTVDGGRGPARFADAGRLVVRAERLPACTPLRPRSKLRRRYLALQATLLDELVERTGATTVLDSSKTSWINTWRLPLLRSLLPDAYSLVLVRELGAVVRSTRSGRGDTLEPQRLPTVRSVIGWSLANLSAVATGLLWCGRDRTRLLRYEDLAAEPAETLAAIVEWIGLPPTDAHRPEAVAEGFTPGLQVQGNRVRRQSRIWIRSAAARPGPGGFAGVVIAMASGLVDRLALRRIRPIVPQVAETPVPSA